MNGAHTTKLQTIRVLRVNYVDHTSKNVLCTINCAPSQEHSSLRMGAPITSSFPIIKFWTAAVIIRTRIFMQMHIFPFTCFHSSKVIQHFRIIPGAFGWLISAYSTHISVVGEYFMRCMSCGINQETRFENVTWLLEVELEWKCKFCLHTFFV